MHLLRSFIRTIQNDWHRETPRMLFNILIAFLVTFTLAHLYSLFVPFYVFVKGYHIHHFYYGMLLLAISSIVGVVTVRDKVRHFFSYVIGVGIGLIVDELGLLLNCTGEKVGLACRYIFPNTFDIMMIIAVLLLIFIFFGNKPIRWMLPKSWQSNRLLNADLTKEVRDIFTK